VEERRRVAKELRAEQDEKLALLSATELWI